MPFYYHVGMTLGSPSGLLPEDAAVEHVLSSPTMVSLSSPSGNLRRHNMISPHIILYLAGFPGRNLQWSKSKPRISYYIHCSGAQTVPDIYHVSCTIGRPSSPEVKDSRAFSITKIRKHKHSSLLRRGKHAPPSFLWQSSPFIGSLYNLIDTVTRAVEIIVQSRCSDSSLHSRSASWSA